MILQDLWWMDYLLPALLLLIALLLSVWGIVIHTISKNRQRKHERLSAIYYKKVLGKTRTKKPPGIIKRLDAMAIDKFDLTVRFNAGQRLHGLNKIAEIRAGMRAIQERSQKPVREIYQPLTRKSAEEELSRFLDDMRDKHDEHHDDNIRALSALFYLAGIKTARHGIEVTEMSNDEKKALIIAMNHCRAMVSLFPKQLTLPG